MSSTKRTAQDLTVGAEDAAIGSGSKKRKGGASASPALEAAAKHLKVGKDEASTGILIEFASDDNIHIALGLAHSPIPQGADPAASAAALQEWVRLKITAVFPNSSVPLAEGSKVAGFHHLDFAMFMECLAALNVDGWRTECIAAETRAGAFVAVHCCGKDKHRFTPGHLGGFV